VRAPVNVFLGDVTVYAEALLIYSQKSEPKEMLYSEFEAVLNGMVTLPEYADHSRQAVYVQVDGQLSIKALVFFQLPFDAQGGVAGHWDMPLRTLADRGRAGPLLEGKNTRLVCKSQCSPAWHAAMWEPCERNGRDPFEDIVRILKRNRLGLLPDVKTLESEDDSRVADAQQRIRQFMERERQMKLRLRQMENRLQEVNQRADELAAENGKLKAYIRALKSRYLKLKAISGEPARAISGE